jgi:hypothetical protein
MKQTPHTICSIPGNETLFAVVEHYLVKMVCMPVHSYDNRTGKELYISVRTTTGISVSSDKEISTELDMGLSFQGLTLWLKAGAKTFTTQETTQQIENKLNYLVPPHTSFHIYQRTYQFVTKFWFILDAWGKLWNVGGSGSNEPVTFTLNPCVNSDEIICSNDELSLQEASSEPEGLTPVTPAWKREGRECRTLGDCTEKCRSHVTKWAEKVGIDC